MRALRGRNTLWVATPDSMEVLFINQFFWPDTAATGQLLTDVTRDIDPNIHAVTVLCGRSLYGGRDAASPPPVKIMQCGGVTFSRGKIGRVVSYASFFVGAAMRGLWTSRPALVVTLTTPPLVSLLGTFFKSLRGSRHYIWEMDLYPDIAVDLNVLKRRSIMTRLVGTLADISRNRADGIIALGNEMKARLVARGIPEHKILVAENWADGDEIVPGPFPEGPLVVHYSGTFGLAHEQHTISEAMRELRDDNRFRFVFAGGGARRVQLEEFCRAEGIGNAEFRSYASRSELGQSLAEGHVGLVTQISETAGSIVPSKTYGIMAAARPMLYVGPEGATPSLVLRQYECGWRIEPGDVVGMVRLLKRLEEDRALVREAGARARRAFEKYHDRPIAVARILSILGLSHTSRPTPASCVAESTV
jgi:colanic acid biosynthesis glycosyl transferase WcaI